MAMLSAYAHTLRSKNAGAFVLTIDVMLKSEADYQRVVQSPEMSPATIAALYKVRPEDVSVIAYPQVRAIKITMPRIHGSGDLGDSDVYGAQQHAPLMMLELSDSPNELPASAARGAVP
ncbi:DUF4387 domain-containing protein [Chelatococcus sp. GCM10030263]|uniref:DUF4387 domain-containing protein n=1 Tax=Chelatococcus sp. GCM10030263 TaxID=3273387 RepID=UPI00361963C6